MPETGRLARRGQDDDTTAGRGAVARSLAWLAAQVSAERERWVLWLPVAFGVGTAVYFLLPREPDPVLGPLGVVAALVAGYALRRRAWAPVVAVALGAAALGFALAQWHGARAEAPVLAKRLGPATVVGTVQDRSVPGDRERMILHRLEISGLAPEATPERVRLLVAGGIPDRVKAGDRVRLRAVLQPPPRPAAPGAFDFARQAYFQRIGAVGYAVSAIAPARAEATRTGPPEGAFVDALVGYTQTAWSRWRQAVARRVLEVLPGAAGGIAAAPDDR